MSWGVAVGRRERRLRAGHAAPGAEGGRGDHPRGQLRGRAEAGGRRRGAARPAGGGAGEAAGVVRPGRGAGGFERGDQRIKN